MSLFRRMASLMVETSLLSKSPVPKYLTVIPPHNYHREDMIMRCLDSAACFYP